MPLKKPGKYADSPTEKNSEESIKMKGAMGGNKQGVDMDSLFGDGLDRHGSKKCSQQVCEEEK